MTNQYETQQEAQRRRARFQRASQLWTLKQPNRQPDTLTAGFNETAPTDD